MARRIDLLSDLIDLGCTVKLTSPDGEDIGNLNDLTNTELDQLAMELDPTVDISDDGRTITYNGNGTPATPFDASEWAKTNAWTKKTIGIK